MPGRVTLEHLEERYPRVLPTLRDHPGVGFVLVRSEQHGADRARRARDALPRRRRVEGEDPLAPFGPNAARHVARTDGFAHCPDIVVNSTYWAETDEVAAFEELVGSHGGMGGPQSYPFVLLPAASDARGDAVGAEAVHRGLRRWLAQLGHTAYRARRRRHGGHQGPGRGVIPPRQRRRPPAPKVEVVVSVPTVVKALGDLLRRPPRVPRKGRAAVDRALDGVRPRPRPAGERARAARLGPWQGRDARVRRDRDPLFVIVVWAVGPLWEGFQGFVERPARLRRRGQDAARLQGASRRTRRRSRS